MTGRLTDAERDLITDLRMMESTREPRPGYRYASAFGLLLDVGRLFTPRPWPGGPPPGELGACYTESVLWATESADGLAYVEGVAWQGLYPEEHAWCADTSGMVLDPTWPDLGTAYLGLPVEPSIALDLMRRHRDALLTYGPVTADWLRYGVPHEILVDIGRPVPPPPLPRATPDGRPAEAESVS